MANQKKARKKSKKRGASRRTSSKRTSRTERAGVSKRTQPLKAPSKSHKLPIEAVPSDPISQLDSDFAQLIEEVDRIKAQPHGWGQEQLAPLLEIKESWLEHLEKEPNQAKWRRNLLSRLAESYEQIIRGGHRVDMDGKMSLEPSSELLTREMTPVIEELISQGKVWLEDALKNLKPISIITQENPHHSNNKGPLQKENQDRGSSTSGEPGSGKEDTPEQKPILNQGDKSPEIEFKIDLSSLLGNLFKPPEK